MRIIRARAELRESKINPKASKEDRQRSADNAFRDMLKHFNRRVKNAEIIQEWKKHQYFESKSEKRRRKRKEVALKIHKERLMNHFG